MDSNDNNKNWQGLPDRVTEYVDPRPQLLVKSSTHPSFPYSTESNVPSRFKESSFRRFETALELYTKRYPEPLYVTPQGLSLETFSCRLRDSVKALMRNPEWNLRLRDELLRCWSDTVVAYHEGQVRIGRRDQKQQKGSFEVVKNVLASTQVTNEIKLSYNPALGQAACTLLGLLNGEVQIRFTGIDLSFPSLQQTLQSNPNVEAFQDGEDVVLL